MKYRCLRVVRVKVLIYEYWPLVCYFIDLCKLSHIECSCLTLVLGSWFFGTHRRRCSRFNDTNARLEWLNYSTCFFCRELLSDTNNRYRFKKKTWVFSWCCVLDGGTGKAVLLPTAQPTHSGSMCPAQPKPVDNCP